MDKLWKLRREEMARNQERRADARTYKDGIAEKLTKAEEAPQ
jgi:hypothetical protein